MINRSCSCPFCQIPRVLSLAIEKRAFAAPVAAPIPAPKPVRAISMATAGRQLTNLDLLLRRGLISAERHAIEVETLKARLGR
jgi:hypothetical protein